MENKNNNKYLLRFVVYSLLGIFMFFIPIKIGEKTTIPVDHVVQVILRLPYYRPIYGLAMVVAGTFLPFIDKSWNKNKVKLIFTIINLTAIPFAIMSVFKIGPEALLDPTMVPFIYDKTVVPVTTIVPVGSIFLAFLISYGLMEFIGVFMQPVMKPIWRTPGRSAIDAVASFVGSYSIALLITNKVYRIGKYTAKEAAIIATGFSTVSATFMIIVANTLGFMEHWNFFFWTTVIVTFAVTAITARIYPLSKKPDEYFENSIPDIEVEIRKDKFRHAMEEAMEVSKNSPTLIENSIINFKDGFMLAVTMAPSLMAVGSLGLIIARFTPIFDYVGFIFLPFTKLMGLEEPMLAAKALASTIADMFVPAPIVANAALSTRFIVAVTSISEILFFSASIPCMMATDIPLNMKDYMLIWIERVILSALLALPFLMLYQNFILK